MKISLRWLKEYVDIMLSPAELAGRLTMSGTEVSHVETVGGQWDNVFVGQITAIEPHPNADRLRLATVDIAIERLTVVCGAPNIQVGQKVPFAKVGAELIDGHSGERAKLKPAKIRGFLSQGMVCSEKELGISDDHTGILILPADAPLGVPLASYLGDAILDLEVTPNRPDCLCVIGVAREVAALVCQQTHIKEPAYAEAGKPASSMASVEIQAPELCGRYCASVVTGIKIGPSPSWMQHRLQACGMRPINNVVDITNYVMLEYGQPLHAFDYDRLTGHSILVRQARPGERMMSLDDVERTLTQDMLVIADPRHAVAIAGVMGGADSEVTDGTTSLLLESANFKATSIRRTSQQLRLRSEASLRFDKGLSPELTVPALRRATQLVLELAGGDAAQGIIDVYPGKRERQPIVLSTREVKRVLGLEMKRDDIAATLAWLGFDCQPAASEELSVRAPYWRGDITLPADLVEEVGRVIGYDQIPTTMLSGSIPQQPPDPVVTFKEQLRDILVGCGLQEVITYSLTNEAATSKALPDATGLPAPLKLANPMTAEQDSLRLSLRPSLLSTVAYNERFGEAAVKLFEVGRAYLPREKDLPDERDVVAGVLAGARDEQSWHGAPQPLDFFDAKGVVEALLGRLSIEATFEPAGAAGLRPGRTARVMVQGEALGVIGEVQPRVTDAFDIALRPVSIFELEVEKLRQCSNQVRKYRTLPRFPSTIRDLALVVGNDVPAKKVGDILGSYPLVVGVNLFDVYTGQPIPAGKKSLAYHIVFQAPDRTLTDEEVDKVQQDMVQRLERELGATLRS